jgi:NuA3 HAT complex component NTO1
MAPMATTTPQTAPRRRGRPRKYPLPPDSEPPLKKQKFNASGFARDILRDATEGSLTIPRIRPSRRHSDNVGGTSGRTPATPFPRIQEGDTHQSYGSAAAVASVFSQSDSYKPREERSWEEFHPELDIDLNLPVYAAEDVDGPGTPSQNGQLNGSPVLGQALQMLHQQNGSPITTNSSPTMLTPVKRRPGRPPKRPEAIMYGLGSPNQRITPAPLHNPKEKLVLPKPNFRRIDTFASYEKSPGVGINFVEKTFANVGYQESDIFQQPATLIRGGKNPFDDENDPSPLKTDSTNALVASGGGSIAQSKVRVEYDMDEQDECWLKVINDERHASGVDIIRPQYFEIAMTLIEKEWHALEKSKLMLRLIIEAISKHANK